MESGAKWFVLGITLSNMPPFLPPWSEVSAGMPNNWGAGCVTAALLEGLAGIEDIGAGFRAARVSPRWLAAGIAEAEVTVRYPSSRGYVSYRYRQQSKTMTLDCTSCADKASLRIPLPPGSAILRTQLNGKTIAPQLETVEQTQYISVQVETRGVHRLEVELV